MRPVTTVNSMRWFFCGILGLFWLAACCRVAGSPVGTIRMTAYPMAVVADGKSLVTVSIIVTDRDGHAVADGTEVTLTSSRGQLRRTSVTTVAGVARAELVAGTIPGHATVTATAIMLGAIGEIDIDFVANRRALQDATDYIEVSGRDYLCYFSDLRWVAASGKKRGATVRFRDVEITADDLQLDSNGDRVVARNAKLKVGKDVRECEQLSYALRTRRGLAVSHLDNRPQLVNLVGAGIESKAAFKTDAEYQNLQEQLHGRDDLDNAEAYVTATSLTIFPNQKVQFHRAKVYVGGTKVVSMPLYSMDMWNDGRQLFATNLIGFNDGRLSLDVPLYYALSPRTTGDFRIRTQQRDYRSVSASHGLFLDMEHSYHDSDRYDGQFILSDIMSNDWSANWRHSMRLGESTSAYFMIDSPEHKGAYLSASLTRQFVGYHASLNLSQQKQFQGFDPQTQRLDIFLETEPRRMGRSPFLTTFGLTSTRSSLKTPDGSTFRESGTGLRWQTSMEPIRLGKDASVRAGTTVSRLFGGTSNDFDILSTIATTLRLRRIGSLNVNYDFAQDSLSASALGKHRLSAQLYGVLGRTQMTLSGAMGLDADYTNIIMDASYRLGPLFRLGFGLTNQSFRGFGVSETVFSFGYQLGLRELALTYSRQTNRIGFEVRSTPF